MWCIVTNWQIPLFKLRYLFTQLAYMSWALDSFTGVKRWKLFMGTDLRAAECDLPYEITLCYLPPDTGEHALS